MTKSSPLIWHLLSNRQIDGEDFENFRGLLRKHELYLHKGKPQWVRIIFEIEFLFSCPYLFRTYQSFFHFDKMEAIILKK